MRVGVSISKNPSSAKNARVRVATRLRRIRFLWISGRRRSRKRYSRRRSSFVLLFSSIGKGGVSDSARIRKDSALTSMAPVARFSFTAPERASTRPSTAITNSLLNFSAFSKFSVPQSFSSKMIWRIPERSLKSTKIIPPLFLLFWTQPMTVTFSPIWADVNSVHLWDRFSPTIDSALIFLLL